MPLLNRQLISRNMKKYWKSIEEYNNNICIDPYDEKPDISLVNLLEKQQTASRRDFLKVFGFSIASAAIAASCEQPVTKAIPYLIQPEEVTPGQSN